MSSITELVKAWNNSNSDALDKLISIAYERLHTSAKRALGYVEGDASLQATELVNELYVHFKKQEDVSFNDSQHFFAIAALKIRQILSLRYQKKNAAKRNHGSRAEHQDLNEVADSHSLFESIIFFEMLESLERLDPTSARIIELRVFWEFSVPEVSDILNMGERTVSRKWVSAKAILVKKMMEHNGE